MGKGRRLPLGNLTVGEHVLTASATDVSGDSGRAGVRIKVLPSVPATDECTEVIRGGDFEGQDWGGWYHDGSPEPQRVEFDEGTGEHVAVLGSSTDVLSRGRSTIRHFVRLPESNALARLSYRYAVGTRDPSKDYDGFDVSVTDANGRTLEVLRRHVGRTGWLTATHDLKGYAGRTIAIEFEVTNDGQAGFTWAYVDDVEVCISAAPDADHPDPTGLGAVDDYAPSGVPDFDQRQDGWQAPDTNRWTWDAPVAAANALWYADSVAEEDAEAPPTVSDNHALVSAYGAWDDHDARNAAPLVANLESRFATNQGGLGTQPAAVVTGLEGYLAGVGLADAYDVTAHGFPSFDWVRSELKQGHAVVGLLGFWESRPDGWRRLGGHYVTLSGASGRLGDGSIVMSDPARDRATFGSPGVALPSDAPAPGPDMGRDEHNDASHVSHDRYGVMRVSHRWGSSGMCAASETSHLIWGSASAQVSPTIGSIPTVAARSSRSSITPSR